MIEPQKYVNIAIAHFQAHSLLKDTPYLSSVMKRLEEETAGAKSVEETYATINEAAKRLDKHGGLTAPSELLENPEIDYVEAKRLDKHNGIVYLNIPGLQSGKEHELIEWATRAHECIRDVENSGGVDGYIIDLRWNTGGNLGPIIAALGPFCNKGALGYFKIGTELVRMDYRDGAVGFLPQFGSVRYVENPYWIASREVPIFGLVGGKTKSAGESLAIILKTQRELNATLIGEETCGCTTVNNTYRMPDGANLHVTAGVFADLYGQRYGGPVVPDKVFSVGEYEKQPALADIDKDRLVTFATKRILEMSPKKPAIAIKQGRKLGL